jgi:hypothetical protein
MNRSWLSGQSGECGLGSRCSGGTQEYAGSRSQEVDRISGGRTSGKTALHRLLRGGGRTANSALHVIAIVRMGRDPRTRAFVTTQRAKGPQHKRGPPYPQARDRPRGYRHLAQPQAVPTSPTFDRPAEPRASPRRPQPPSSGLTPLGSAASNAAHVAMTTSPIATATGSTPLDDYRSIRPVPRPRASLGRACK